MISIFRGFFRPTGEKLRSRATAIIHALSRWRLNLIDISLNLARSAARLRCHSTLFLSSRVWLEYLNQETPSLTLSKAEKRRVKGAGMTGKSVKDVDRYQAVLSSLLAQDENKFCADCRAKGEYHSLYTLNPH